MNGTYQFNSDLTRKRNNKHKSQINNSGKKVGTKPDITLVEVSKQGKNSDDDEDKQETKEQDKILTGIKISNNKLNLTTFGVIVLFLTYFSVCFGVSLKYMNQINGYITTYTHLY